MLALQLLRVWLSSVREDLHRAAGRVDLSVSAGRVGTAHLQPVLAAVPLHRGREVTDAGVNARVAAKLRVVRRKDDAVLACPVRPNAVIRVRVGGVEVEDEEQISPLKDDDLVHLRRVSVDTCRQKIDIPRS